MTPLNNLSKIKPQEFKIRFANEDKLWRVIRASDGYEILVEDVFIQVPCNTTKDWIESVQQYKYHLSCVGCLFLRSNQAYIFEMK